MEQEQLGKVIRRSVTVGVALLFFGSTFVVGNTLKLLIFGPEKEITSEEYAVISPPMENRRASRSLASIPRNADGDVPAEESGVYPARDSQLKTYFKGGFLVSAEEARPEYTIGEVENSQLEIGSTDGGMKSPESTIPSAYLAWGGSQTPTSPGAKRGSEGAGGTSSPGIPGFSPTLLHFSVTGGSMNGVTGGGYKVNAVGGAPLSAVHGITGAGYRVWLNESGQAFGY